MNRIYQGKVTKVETLENGKWEKLDDWQTALWRHHELFQDAVNYYTVCLRRILRLPKGENRYGFNLSQLRSSR